MVGVGGGRGSSGKDQKGSPRDGIAGDRTWGTGGASSSQGALADGRSLCLPARPTPWGKAGSFFENLSLSRS